MRDSILFDEYGLIFAEDPWNHCLPKGCREKIAACAVKARAKRESMIEAVREEANQAEVDALKARMEEELSISQQAADEVVTTHQETPLCGRA